MTAEGNKTACNYQGYEFGAGSYPDSVCIDGRLWDADDCDEKGNLYEPVDFIPCPMCDRKAAIKYWTERQSLGGVSKREATRAATSLVDDIRRNRLNGTEPWRSR